MPLLFYRGPKLPVGAGPSAHLVNPGRNPCTVATRGRAASVASAAGLLPWYSRPTEVGLRPTELVSATLVLLALALLPVEPAWAQQVEPASVHQAEISTHLQAQLAGAETPVSFLVILRDQVDAQATVTAQGTSAANRTTRAQMLYTQLTATAQRSQASLRAWLDAEGISYRPYYIVNMIEVEGDAALAESLRLRSEIDRLAANPLVGQDSNAHAVPMEEQAATLPDMPNAPDLPFGLVHTRANEVWEMGITGGGIVLASQDTGVQWNHPALIAQYRGWDATTGSSSHVYNWYDAWDSHPCTTDAQEPCDDHGHGTHTVGTMVGDATGVGGTVLGMAPSAQWMGCRNMLNGVGSPASYTACFEFFLAPYPQGGDPFTDGRPAMAPHIINNSWGCPPYEGCDVNSLRQVVETARAAGQLVVASAGNDGNKVGNDYGCGSVSKPLGMHDAVFSVGAHDEAGDIASFSSRGPVTIDGSNRMKPDIAAPGVSVLSTFPHDTYSQLSGTSMASPHVAGAAALLWSAVPDMIGQVDQTEQLLIKSAVPVPNNECGESPNPIVPNATYGYGRLDVLNAVDMALHPWQVGFQITDSDGEPLSGVKVDLTDQLTGYEYVGHSGFNGITRFTSVYSGAYTCEIRSPVALIGHADVIVEPTNGTGMQEPPEIGPCTLFSWVPQLYFPVISD